MQRTVKSILVIYSWLFFSLSLVAQNNLGLPKLYPSYSESFSDYASYPSICFEKAFWDGQGRIWLVPCGIVLNTLFQFDGYNFIRVKGDLENLSSTNLFSGILDGQFLIGSSEVSKGEKRLIAYDLYTNELSIPSIAYKGKLMYVSVWENERVFLVSVSGGILYFYEWTHQRLTSQGQFSLEKQSIRYDYFSTGDFFMDEDEFWIQSNDQAVLLRIQKKSGKATHYKTSDLFSVERPSTNGLGAIEWMRIGNVNNKDRYFILKSETEGNFLFHTKAQNQQIESVKNVPEDWNIQLVATDKIGNKLFLFHDEQDQFRAILEDPLGKQFDYSAFFRDFPPNTIIDNLYSPDFRDQLFICHSKGIQLQKVKLKDAIRYSPPYFSVRALAELPGQQFLVTTQRNGTFFLDGKTLGTSTFNLPGCNFGKAMSGYSMNTDADGNVWIKANSALLRYSPSTNSCQKFETGIESIRLFQFVAQKKILIVTESNQLFILDLNVNEVTAITDGSKPIKLQGVVSGLVQDTNNTLWVASNQGLQKLILQLREARASMSEVALPSPGIRLLSISIDDQKRLWLGTAFSGLLIYDPATGKFKRQSQEHGLINNTIASILEDNDGDRWLNTYNGISVVDSEGELITNIATEDGLVELENNRFSTLKAKNGHLLIGTINGLHVIDPSALKASKKQSRDLQIYLTSVEYYDIRQDSVIFQQNKLSELAQVDLSSSHRYIKLNFGLSNYFKPEENQYAYMLEGLDREWTFIGTQPTLILNNLPAGKYDLLVKGGDSFGNWTDSPIRVRLRVQEFFYKSIWFYMLLFLLLAALAWIWIAYLRSEIKRATKEIRRDKETIEQQKEKLIELDQAKSRFFTNISHEFRTPLTIISGMIDQIEEKPEIWLKRGISLIKQNTFGLLNLVNQILDLRKLEANELKMEMVQGDVVKYLKYLTESHQSYAANKGLQLHFLSSQSKINMDYDPDKLLRIITNLLSNAVKFTPEGGNVYFQISKRTEGNQALLHLQVQDTGIGIPAADLPFIFGRFYQVDDSSTRRGEGTGIGLALTSELVKLLGGEIKAKSKVGQGSTFHIELPITENAKVQASDAFDISKKSTAIEPAFSELMLAKPQEDLPTNVLATTAMPNLLIVEDNLDVQQYLVACLEDDYQLTLADDGQAGIDKALEQVPDLIVSDVMMPEKDGYELTQILKNDERTSHIPIILLTAKADIDSKISGLEQGADAYLAKPFEQRELLVRLKKLLELRQKLQERYRSINPEQAPENKEDVFVQKVRQVVLDNLSDDTFGIAQLCRKIALSRAQLHNKLKALTGQSTSHFIRSIRLREAKKLLKDSDLNVSEVGYEVGFKNPAHFSTAFQEEFGTPPSKTYK